MAARWCATLDRAMPQDGTMPQGIHFCLCLPDAPTAALGPDGHPRRSDDPASLLPPIALPRRMWASSAMTFHARLRVGEAVTRTTRVAAIDEKQGGSGALVFVRLLHETSGPAGLAVSEVQTLVYRDAPPAGSPPVPAPPGSGHFDASAWDVHRALTPEAPLLFRYSALTFNSHRIHYDYPYVTGQEGYRGLVVHGPLMATLVLDLAQRELGDNALKTFQFRAMSPAIAGEMLHLVLRREGAALRLGASAADGREVLRAEASV
ncbi:FAS1-like dehydratase domain-containing protein [Parablastomonas sp. CN1-191]|uniref:FAS1-like dehydratase domain-containing protein n=1 Tax=Parablastomonas sp. CN1-191 TaxID=3400908 RepID=UPI003BF886FE